MATLRAAPYAKRGGTDTNRTILPATVYISSLCIQRYLVKPLATYGLSGGIVSSGTPAPCNLRALRRVDIGNNNAVMPRMPVLPRNHYPHPFRPGAGCTEAGLECHMFTFDG